MDNLLLAFLSAFWLGILTSISPCPLASNIASLSFLSKRITHPFMVFISGFFYTIGRMFSYALLAFVIINSFLSVPIVANFLQKYIGKALGPILIIVGILLLDILKFNMSSFSLSQKHQDNLSRSGAGGAFVLGFIFAFAFCPISAALFFGSLIPLALNNRMSIIFPFVYGAGTGLPVLLFAFLIALGVSSLGHWFEKLRRLENYTRKITGVIFILVGLYYIFAYIL